MPSSRNYYHAIIRERDIPRNSVLNISGDGIAKPSIANLIIKLSTGMQGAIIAATLFVT